MTARFAILALALAIVSPADTLRMRDGSTVTGSFLGATSDDIRFLVNDEVQHFARVNVAEIVFSPVSGSSSDAQIERPPADRAPVDKAPAERGPDYANAPFLRGANGYIPLEKEYATASRGGGMMGMGAPVYRIQGPSRSPVRVRQADRIVFVVRFDSNGDPRQFQLVRLESRMGYRQTQSTMGGTPAALPLTVTKVGDSVYELTPARALYPGEYAVTPINSSDSYCFGVDY